MAQLICCALKLRGGPRPAAQNFFNACLMTLPNLFTTFYVKSLLFAPRLCYNQSMANRKFRPHFGKVSAILIAVCIALIGIDILLKYLEEAYNWNFVVIPGFIWVESGHHNPGAAFSFLAGAEWGQLFLILFSVILLALMIAAFIFVPERCVFLKVALVMIIAGALGNLYDRLLFGYVRDFVWVNMLFSTSCCNFADFFIVFGVIFAVIDFLFLNEWALIPLTKRAKAAQAKNKNTSDASATENADGGNEESGGDSKE